MLWRMTLQRRRGKSPLAIESIDDRYCHLPRGAVARNAEHGDADLNTAHLAAEPINHFHGVYRKVDEPLLAGDMELAQGTLEAAGPFHVAFAEPQIPEAV